jgi:hypothetical protein
METPDLNPLSRFQGCLLPEGPFLEAIWLVESNRANPALLAGVGAFQDGDVGTSRQKLIHTDKVSRRYTDKPVASVSGRSPIIQKYPL